MLTNSLKQEDTGQIVTKDNLKKILLNKNF